MAAGRKKNTKGSRSSVQDFVTVAFAEDMELARQNKKLLEDNGITARIQDPGDSSGAPGIAVLVHEEDLDEAHALIASHASFEAFFDGFFRGEGFLLDDLDDEND